MSSPTTVPDASSSVPRPLAARPRRQPRWIAVGLLAICLGALGAVLLYTEASGSRSVVVVAADVSRGQVIQATTLTTQTIGSAPGLKTVPADQLASLVGQRAKVDLLAGTLLPPGAIGQVNPRPGYTQLGLRLAPGRLPLETLPPGTPIQLVAVAAQGTDGTTQTSGGADQQNGRVFAGSALSAAQLTDDGQYYVLDVEVPTGSASDVARLAAADRLVLIRQPPG